MLNVCSHERSGMLGPKSQTVSALCAESVHFLIHYICTFSDAAAENFFMLKHRSINWFEAIIYCHFLRLLEKSLEGVVLLIHYVSRSPGSGDLFQFTFSFFCHIFISLIIFQLVVCNYQASHQFCLVEIIEKGPSQSKVFLARDPRIVS